MKAMPLACLLALSSAASAAADPTPNLKAGMWEMTTNMPMLPAPYNKTVSTMCVDDAVQRRWSVMAQNAPGIQCQPPSVRLVGGVYRYSSTCDMGGRKVTTSGTVSGDFTSRYEVTARSEGLPGPAAAAGFSGSGRYMGACTGLKPGQMRVMGRVMPM